MKCQRCNVYFKSVKCTFTDITPRKYRDDIGASGSAENKRYIWGDMFTRSSAGAREIYLPCVSPYRHKNNRHRKSRNSRKNFFQKPEKLNKSNQYRSSIFNLNTPKLSTCSSANLRAKNFIKIALK